MSPWLRKKCDLYAKVDGYGHDGGTGCIADRAGLLRALYGTCGSGRGDRQ